MLVNNNSKTYAERMQNRIYIQIRKRFICNYVFERNTSQEEKKMRPLKNAYSLIASENEMRSRFVKIPTYQHYFFIFPFTYEGIYLFCFFFPPLEGNSYRGDVTVFPFSSCALILQKSPHPLFAKRVSGDEVPRLCFSPTVFVM